MDTQCISSLCPPYSVGPLSLWHGTSSGCGRMRRSPVREVAVNMLNKHLRRADNGVDGFGIRLNISHRKNIEYFDKLKRDSDLRFFAMI
jgi:hypothetical protein